MTAARVRREPRAGEKRSGGRSLEPAAAAPPIPPPLMSRGPLAVAAAVAALCALAACTFPIYDTDIWQHLVVGREIWRTHAVPHTQLWTWPTHGAPDVLPSWLFRAALWPFWQLGGIGGLFAWRWSSRRCVRSPR